MGIHSREQRSVAAKEEGGGSGPCCSWPGRRMGAPYTNSAEERLEFSLEWQRDLAAHKGGGRASCHPLVLRAMRLLAGGVFSLSFHLTGGDMR